MDLRELYQEIILDHGRHPRNFKVLDGHSHSAHGHNPLCGDTITVYLKIDGDRIAGVSFKGHGCAISTASASLMSEILTGKTLDEAQKLFKSFHLDVTGGDNPGLPPDLEDDGDRLSPLTGVKNYPARVKCATLAWHTFDAAVKGEAEAAPVKTE